MVRRCVEGPAPPYLRELCCSSAAAVSALLRKRSADLIVPRSRTTRRVFSVAGSRPENINGSTNLRQIPVTC